MYSLLRNRLLGNYHQVASLGTLAKRLKPQPAPEHKKPVHSLIHVMEGYDKSKYCMGWSSSPHYQTGSRFRGAIRDVSHKDIITYANATYQLDEGPFEQALATSEAVHHRRALRHSTPCRY